MSDKKLNIPSFPLSVLRQGYSFFQSESYIECHLVLNLSTSSILSSPYSCLLLLSRLPVTFILPTTFPSVTCFRRQFLRKMCPNRFSLLSIPCMQYIPLLHLIFLHYSLDRSSWSSSCYSATFQNFQSVSDLLPTVPTFQHHTKFRSKCSI